MFPLQHTVSTATQILKHTRVFINVSTTPPQLMILQRHSSIYACFYNDTQAYDSTTILKHTYKVKQQGAKGDRPKKPTSSCKLQSMTTYNSTQTHTNTHEHTRIKAARNVRARARAHTHAISDTHTHTHPYT